MVKISSSYRELSLKLSMRSTVWVSGGLTVTPSRNYIEISRF